MEHFPWTWSAAHGDYYYATVDRDGKLTYHWSRGPAKQSTMTSFNPQMNSPQVSRNRVESMPSPVPHDMRAQIPDFIAGAPEKGWFESLDPSYRMRTGNEAYRFFAIGRVFAMLHTQTAGESTSPSDSVTIVKYGEHAYSQIRRFVVVEVRRGFVYACPLSTYSRRGTLKPGCIPKEHSIMYLTGQSPTPLPNEYLEKEPIRVIPADASIHMDPATRIHYAKVYPIEMTVKFKDIGTVDPADCNNLLRYYREENHLRC